MNFINYIVTIALSFSALFGYGGGIATHQDLSQIMKLAPQQSTLVGSTLPIAGQTYTLSGAGVSSSATSITLQSFTITQTGQPILTGNLSDIFYITIEPGSRTRQEIVGCTTVTQNANGTATLSGCSRGLAPVTPYTASTTLQFVHGGGSQVIFSDPPQLYNLYGAKANNETVTGIWNFSGGLLGTASSTFTSTLNLNGSTAITNGAASTWNATTTFNQGALGVAAYDCSTNTVNTQYCQKAYIDGVAVAGASNANTTTKGIVQEATVAQINAGTQTGSTGAILFMDPANYIASNYGSFVGGSTYATTSLQSLASSTLSSIPGNNNLIVTFMGSSTVTNASLDLRFNGDTSAKYVSAQTDNGGSAGSDTTSPFIPLVGTAGQNFFATINISNLTGSYKMGNYLLNAYDSSGNPAHIVTGSFIWKNTAKITSITFDSSVGVSDKFLKGTYITASGF